jgi:hypothetical protein
MSKNIILVDAYQHFRGTSVNIYRTTQCYIPEDINFHSHCHENSNFTKLNYLTAYGRGVYITYVFIWCPCVENMM